MDVMAILQLLAQKKKVIVAKEKMPRVAIQKTNVVESLMASVIKQRKIAVKKK